MKKLYYTVHPNYYCRELHVYEIVDNEPKVFAHASGETFEDTEADDKRNISEALLEEKELAESEYELKEL